MEDKQSNVSRQNRLLALIMAIGGLLVWIFSFINVDPHIRKFVMAGTGMLLWLIGAQNFLRSGRISHNGISGKHPHYFIGAYIFLIVLTLVIVLLLLN